MSHYGHMALTAHTLGARKPAGGSVCPADAPSGSVMLSTAGRQAAHCKPAAADLCTWNELLHLALQVVEHHIVPARVDNGIFFCKVQVAIDISPQAKGMSAMQQRKTMSLRL